MREIDEQELRLGNYLQDGKGRLCKVKSLPLESFGVAAIDGPITTMPISQIPLTEDTVRWFDYSEEEDGFPPVIEGYEVMRHTNGYSLAVDGMMFGEIMRSVHELQNLLFALNKMEPAIKIKNNGKN